MSLLQIINDLSAILNEEDTQQLSNNDMKEYDLLNDKDYNEFSNIVKELNDSELFKSLCTIFDIDKDELCKSVLDMTKLYREENKKPSTTTIKPEEHKEIKKEQKEVKPAQIDRPSQHVDINTGLQIHKLVQEYIDTMVKPYNPKVGGLSNTQINDAYAGLYEYSCWLINHK